MSSTKKAIKFCRDGIEYPDIRAVFTSIKALIQIIVHFENFRSVRVDFYSVDFSVKLKILTDFQIEEGIS